MEDSATYVCRHVERFPPGDYGSPCAYLARTDNLDWVRVMSTEVESVFQEGKRYKLTVREIE